MFARLFILEVFVETAPCSSGCRQSESDRLPTRKFTTQLLLIKTFDHCTLLSRKLQNSTTETQFLYLSNVIKCQKV